MLHELAVVLPLALAAASPEEAEPGAVRFAGVVPQRRYVGVNRSVIVEVRLPSEPSASAGPSDAPGGDGTAGDAAPTTPPEAPRASTGAGLVEIALVGPDGEEVDRAPAEPGAVDLASMFPVLWTTRAPQLLYAQAVLDGAPVGAACVLQPMLTPARASDALTARVAQAVARGDDAFLGQLVGLPASTKQEMAQGVAVSPAGPGAVYSGVRCYVDRVVVLETGGGQLRIALRPDAAPNTAFGFLDLVEGGFYDGVAFHRVINEDPEGRPYIVQAGDPTATGLGGPGFYLDFEPSPIAHDLGVVSIARALDDPNSGGSQFFICLGREACRPLDGLYTSFGEVVGGLETLDWIAATPVGPLDADDPGSPHERPLSPPVIERAWAEPAPPIAARPARVERVEAPSVER